MGGEKQHDHSRGRMIGFWIKLLRGFFAVTLGLVLIFNPEKTRVMLFNTQAGGCPQGNLR